MKLTVWSRCAAVILAVSLTVLAGCGKPAGDAAQPSQETTPEVQQGPVELTLWTYYENGWQSTIDAFRREHPNIDIKVTSYPFAEYAQKYLSALADGTGPDIMLVDSAHLGDFGAIEGVENLLSPPYDAGRYKADFSPSMWDSMMSLDGKRLISLPLDTAPSVTYYRADLLKAYGFPDEPEALGKFMENPDNWLAIGEELQKHGSYIVQWESDLIHLHEASMPFFDRSLNLMRNNDTMVRALDIAKTVNQKGLDANVDIWTEVGEKAVKSGKIAMLYLGTWGADQIQAWAPEQEGKWRATRLPFGLYGFENSSSFILPSEGKHKKEAWQFVEHTATVASKKGEGGGTHAYLPSRGNANVMAQTNPYMGGQHTNALYESLAGQMKERMVTPLDTKAQEIWTDGILSGIEANTDSKTILEGIEKEIGKKLGRDKEILLQWQKNQ
ncbi:MULTISPECIES: ABC transporter substrate-binding protein [Paenibacillus]|uniref:ABC transporter substrate-binding protein n=1 Tax=Paenibacillus TaxID=44249 RepID=UPI0022B8EB52|nr:ABC transporter substrate-binding protein [Paenibacillus caseinilyticus]MCZ8519951.1 ABC transporter substrate-binding protein [Paenibacillus caseinilyticus]